MSDRARGEHGISGSAERWVRGSNGDQLQLTHRDLGSVLGCLGVKSLANMICSSLGSVPKPGRCGKEMLLHGDAAAGPSSIRCAPSGAASAGLQQPVCCSRLVPCWWTSTQGPAPGEISPSLLVDEQLCDACTSAFGASCSSPCVKALAVAETTSADCATVLHPQPGLSACHRRATASQLVPERHNATDVLDPPEVLQEGPGGSEEGLRRCHDCVVTSP